MSHEHRVGAAFLAAVSGLPLSHPGQSMSTPIQLRVADTLQGETYPLLEEALAVLERAGGDARHYAVSLVDDAEPVVVFRARDPHEGVRTPVAVRRHAGTELPADELRAVLARADRHKELPLLDGANLLAVRAAVVAFRQRLPELDPYRITVLRAADTISVLFTDKTAELRGRGSPGKRPGFEVQLDARDLRVLRSNFMR